MCIRDSIFRFEEGLASTQQQEFLDTYHLTILEGPTPVTEFYKARVYCFSCLPPELYTNAIDSINGVIKGATKKKGVINSGGLNYSFDPPLQMDELINYNGLLENCPTNFSLTIPYGNCDIVKTGIFDTGLRPRSHQGLFLPYLNSHTDFGINFISPGLPLDDHDHGTAIASIIVNESANLPSGMPNPNLELRIYKTHTAQGTGDMFDAIYAIDTSILEGVNIINMSYSCLLYTSPSPRDATLSRMPSSA